MMNHNQLSFGTGAKKKDATPYMFVKFPNEEAALQYAIHNQRDRRNMTDADILRCIEAVDKLKPRGGDRKREKSKASSDAIDSGKSAAKTAKMVGTSQSKVEKGRSVLKHAGRIKDAVLSGKRSIHNAYKETRLKKKPKPKQETVAMKFAEKAIKQLEQISKDDPEHKKAIGTVDAWCRGRTREDLYNDLKMTFLDAPDAEGWWWVEVEGDGRFKKGRLVIVYVCANDDLEEDLDPFIPINENSNVLDIKGRWKGPISPPINGADINPMRY